MVSLFGSGCVAQAKREMSLKIAVTCYAEFETPPNENVTAAEFKLKDPDGNAVDASERGWAV